MFRFYYYDSDTSKKYYINTINIVLLFVLLFIAGLFIGRKTVTCPKKPVVVTINYNEPPKIKPPVFHKDSLKAFIKKLNIKHPDIVYAQTLLETGRHESSLFKSNNNLFGMKKAGIRPQLLSGIKNNHAYYEDMYLAGWQLSVIDYAMYQTAFARGLSKKEYLNKLKKSGYAEDDSYVKKLKTLLDEW